MVVDGAGVFWRAGTTPDGPATLALRRNGNVHGRDGDVHARACTSPSLSLIHI